MLVYEGNVKERLTPEEIAVLEKQEAKLQDFLRSQERRPFEPSAFYDDDLDCIRVLVRDCSVTEVRINELLTVAHDNSPDSNPGPIGFTIKGIRAHFSDSGKTLDDVVSLTELLDGLVRNSPEETILQWVLMLKKLTHQNGLEEVHLREAA